MSLMDPAGYTEDDVGEISTGASGLKEMLSKYAAQ